ncbi:MAG: hypothetical protein PVF66_14250 [Candidatus Aminicenantes bacterium]|jgi:hypothetical protein
MKKSAMILSLSAFMLVLFAGAVWSQQVNLSGTWVGETSVPDELEPDKVTLILEKTNGEYNGKVTDAFGFAMEAQLEDIKFEDNKLTSHFLIFTGEEYMKIYFSLTVEGDTMKGYWESEAGDSAPIELHRQK